MENNRKENKVMSKKKVIEKGETSKETRKVEVKKPKELKKTQRLRSNTIVTTTVCKTDTENGVEVIKKEVETQIYKAEETRNFIKCYNLFLETINSAKVKSGVIRTLLNLGDEIKNYDNEFVIDHTTRDRILTNAGITKRSLENHLKILLSNDFIRRIKRGRYMINPLLIAKGRELNIRDLEYKYNSLKKEVVIGKD